ncbi:hypothetical protein O6R05_03680 [Peptoniphilus equinus]|uniref:Uncharacterized protein n=1 Tax=Peptoniphilus equinus TaxID=3016343 RepID=A0ABY7QV46_9FIRM|nr:hypothetical protein [Peptoniphilus equinus]WBW50660.1 hypothetical protein O6R05_03680 [Peptoniphilus equinus]
MQTSRRDLWLSLGLLVVSIAVIAYGIIKMGRFDESFSTTLSQVEADNQKVVEQNKLLDEELDTIDKQLTSLETRKATLGQVVAAFDYEANKYDAYLIELQPLNYNERFINAMGSSDLGPFLASSTFESASVDLETAKRSLLISSMVQNDYIVNTVNTNLLQSNVKVEQGNGLLQYYNGTNNYLLKDKIHFQSQDTMEKLSNNMLLLKQLGLEMMLHLNYGSNDSDGKELTALSNHLKGKNLSGYAVPKQFTEPYHNILKFGTDTYALVNDYTNHVRSTESLNDGHTIHTLRDERNRIFLIEDVGETSHYLYYYDQSARPFCCYALGDGIEEVDLNTSTELQQRAVELARHV